MSPLSLVSDEYLQSTLITLAIIDYLSYSSYCVIVRALTTTAIHGTLTPRSMYIYAMKHVLNL